MSAWRNHALSPALLMALIRTVSAYQADIISASTARGLMQLLPATAARVALALDEEIPGPLALFGPDLNIRYGAWYLAALAEGFGHEALALAGYNGGPYNIKSLISAKPGMPLDVFIESLTSEETVNYVKRVIENRYIYEMAYLGRAVRPDLTGPLPPPQPSLPDF
ncbi:MAG: lytic transglycosylase domain-containing protein [Candidatus Adiutrix sp.]|nr:lytic transglycosylase domain-containing protein [Candidatus Adiutrix sp.]